MNCFLPDDRGNPLSEDIPAAIPSLIDGALAAFDADKDMSRRYLLRASALLRVKRRTRLSVEINREMEPRGGLMAWQLNRLVEHVETHLAEKMTAKELSGLIAVSAGRMFRAFKISVGITPFQYIMRRRVEVAFTLMRTTQKHNAQIAVACGLYDQSHLCRVIRRMTGMSPSDWRRSTQARDALTSQFIPNRRPARGRR